MQQVRRLLIIEENKELLNILSDQIMLTGEFNLFTCSNMQEAFDIITEQRVEIVLFSHKKDEDATLDTLRMWRENGVTIPLIVITDAQDDSQAIKLLDTGVNDYIAKPFRMTLLVARLRAHLRQYDRSSDAVLTIGPYYFHQGNGLLVAGESGQQIRLTDKESNILRQLYYAYPDVISRNKLLGDVWGYADTISTHTLETHIYRLRQKIEPDPKKASILITESRGYRLNIK